MSDRDDMKEEINYCRRYYCIWGTLLAALMALTIKPNIDTVHLIWEGYATLF